MSYSGGFLFLFAVIVLLFFILLVPFTLRIKLHNLQHDTNISVSVSIMLCGRITILSLYRILGAETGLSPDIILKRTEGRVQLKGKKLRKAINLLQRLNRAVLWHELNVMLRIGTGDPAATGIITGILHALGGLFSVILQRNQQFLKINPIILVYPSFFEKELKYHLSLALSTSLGRLMYRVLFSRPNKQEVTRRWQNSIPSRT